MKTSIIDNNAVLSHDDGTPIITLGADTLIIMGISIHPTIGPKQMLLTGNFWPLWGNYLGREERYALFIKRDKLEFIYMDAEGIQHPPGIPLDAEVWESFRTLAYGII